MLRRGISRYDRRHLLVRFLDGEDFINVWTRDRWVMRGQSLKLFCWSAWFRPGLESAIVPVWFDLPQLPPCFYNTGSLASLALVAGRLLRIGSLTKEIETVVGARVCIEVDASKPVLPQKVWLGMGNKEMGIGLALMEMRKRISLLS